MCSCWVKLFFFFFLTPVSKGRKLIVPPDARNINSEKNQLSPCDRVWFPSVLALVSEHDVLSINLVGIMSQICLNEVIANILLVSESF